MRVIRFALLLASAILAAHAMPSAFAQTQTPSAAIDDVSIDAGLMTYRIRRIEAFGGTLTAADLRQLFDANDPKPLPERLRALNAERIVVPEVLVEWKVGPAAETVTYRNLVLTGVTAGHVADASAQGVSMALSDEETGNVSGDFGALAAHNIDLVLAGRIAASSRSDANEPKGLLYESFSLDGGGFVAPKDNVEITFGRISGANVKARPFSMPLGAVPTGSHELTAAEKRVMAGYGADALDSFDVGSFEMRDVRFKGLSDSKPFNGRFDRISMAGVGDAKIEDLSFVGFSTSTADNAHVDLANLSFRGFDMSATRARLKTAAAENGSPLDESKPRELMPNLREFNLAGFEYRGAGAASGGAIIAGTGRGNSVRIGKIEMRGSQPYEGMPTAITGSMDGLSFDVSSTSEDDALRTLAGLGYSRLDVGSRMDVAWRQSAQELAVNEISLTAGGMGGLKLRGSLGNVSKDLFAPEPAVAQAAALSALLKSIDLTVTDQGLLDRMIANEAKRSNRTADAVRSEWVTAAGVGIPAALGDAPAGRTIGSAVSKFIAKPKALHITANAPNGVGAAELMLFSQDPAAFLKRMDVQASAE